jgi:hypothetical protein
MKLYPLSAEEIVKTASPGGRLPLAPAKNSPYGGEWTVISDGSAAARAAAAERFDVRAKPRLVSSRKGKGK